jgi:hypothetical protein
MVSAQARKEIAITSLVAGVVLGEESDMKKHSANRLHRALRNLMWLKNLVN